jgi:hypothetical protein
MCLLRWFNFISFFLAILFFSLLLLLVALAATCAWTAAILDALFRLLMTIILIFVVISREKRFISILRNLFCIFIGVSICLPAVHLFNFGVV